MLAVAEVRTERGSRYLQQLCKHWAHRLPVTFDARQWRVELPNGASLSFEAKPASLMASIRAADRETLESARTVLVKHFDRFAHKEAPLAWSWREEA